MSTKRLARTIVEGGKRKGSSYAHKMWVRAERRKAAVYYNDYSDDNTKPLVHKGNRYEWGVFNDRIRPLVKWLESHVGEPWNDVYSELVSKLDVRKIKDWHLRQHAQQAVTDCGFGRDSFFPRTYGLRVDEHGILRNDPYKRNNYGYLTPAERKTYKDIIDWIGGLMLVQVGAEMMWYTPVMMTYLNYHNEWTQKITGYRQEGPMNRAQRAFWDSLSEAVKGAVLNYCDKYVKKGL